MSGPGNFQALDEEEPDTGIQFRPQSPEKQTLIGPGLIDTINERVVDHTDFEQPRECEKIHEPLQAALHSEGMFLSPANPQISPNNGTPGGRLVMTPRLNFKRRFLSEKKRKALEDDFKVILQNMRPICFVPSKPVDFSKHEILLKRLKLWDFVHFEFDVGIRNDILAFLISNYNPQKKCSYVNGSRINVARGNLAHALMLPLKKEKEGADMDGLLENSAAFLDEFLSNFVLLHDDTWMMPPEVVDMVAMVKSGHSEKVVSLIWFMVEKELLQGVDLVHCYYATHLMCLIKSQKKSILEEDLLGAIPFQSEDAESVQMVNVLINEVDEKDKADVKVEEKAIGCEKKERVEDGDGLGSDVMMGGLDNFECRDPQEQNIDLSLGKDNVVKEEYVDIGMMDFEDSKEDETGQWCFKPKDGESGQFLRRCHLDVTQSLESDIPRIEGEEPEKEDCTFTLDGLCSANLMPVMMEKHVPFIPAGQDDVHPSEKLQAFKNAGKRLIEHENGDGGGDSSHGKHHKKMNMNEDDEFYSCYNQTIQFMHRTLMLYEAKKQACAELNMHTQFLNGEVQQRESLIMHSRVRWCEENEKKQMEINRRDHELCGMYRILEHYRKALKKRDMDFAEYMERCPPPGDEFLYVDVPNSGGLVVSASEMERQCAIESEKQRLKKEEEEEQIKYLIVEQIKEFENEWYEKLVQHCVAVEELDRKVAGFVEDFELVEDLSTRKKFSSDLADHAMEES